MPKVQKNPETDNHYITIPSELRKAMGWKKGNTLEFTVKDSETLELSKD